MNGATAIIKHECEGEGEEGHKLSWETMTEMRSEAWGCLGWEDAEGRDWAGCHS